MRFEVFPTYLPSLLFLKLNYVRTMSSTSNLLTRGDYVSEVVFDIELF